MSLTEYLLSIVVFSAVVGFVSFVAYPGKSEKTIKFATAVLLLYTVLTPVFTVMTGLRENEFEDIFNSDSDTEIGGKDEYLAVAENAFKEGICKLLCSKYGTKPDEMNIFVYDFDFKNMRCEKIKIVLFGRSATLDTRGMGTYITEQGLGKCEVDIRLG